MTPAVVAAWCPAAWSQPRVDVNGKPLGAFEFVKYGTERFLLVPIKKGSSRIVVWGQ